MEDHEEFGYFWEYKEPSLHWKKRLNGLKPPCDGVFLVGSKPNYVRI